MNAVREIPRRHVSPLDERRRMPREAVSAKGLLSRDRFDEEGLMVEVFDLTLQGIGFRSPTALEVGGYHQILVMAGPLRLSSRLRVVSSREEGLPLWRSFVRASLCALFPIGLFWSAVSSRNESIQDLIVRTTVVYDWGPKLPRLQ